MPSPLRRRRPETPEGPSPATPKERWFDAARLEDDVLQRFLVLTQRLFPKFSELQLASMASARRHATATPSMWL